MIIVFEGIDGSGKDTQIGMLAEYLELHGKTFARFKFPSEKARLALSHLNGASAVEPRDLFMDFARDIESSTPQLLEAAKTHDVVIVDRYIFSTIAYQGVPLGFDAALSLASKFRLVKPNLVLFLEISPEKAFARKNAQKTPDRFESDLGFQKQVAKNYGKLAGKCHGAVRWAAIGASESPLAVHRKIIKEMVQE